MALAPLVRILDPRPLAEALARPIAESVCIPTSELVARLAELPSKSVLIQVADVEGASEAMRILEAGGRRCDLVAAVFVASPSRGRLWSPNPWLEECLRTPSLLSGEVRENPSPPLGGEGSRDSAGVRGIRTLSTVWGGSLPLNRGQGGDSPPLGEMLRERQRGQCPTESGGSTSSSTTRTDGLDCPHPGSAGLPPTGEDSQLDSPAWATASSLTQPSPPASSPLEWGEGIPDDSPPLGEMSLCDRGGSPQPSEDCPHPGSAGLPPTGEEPQLDSPAWATPASPTHTSFLERGEGIRRTALDLGCGQGRETAFLSAMGWRVTAIDRHPEAISTARKMADRYGCPSLMEFLVGDFDQLGFDSEDRFDLVLCLFLHVPGVLEFAQRFVAPGGVLIAEGYHQGHALRARGPKHAFRRETAEPAFPRDWQLLWEETNDTLRVMARRP